MVSLVVAQANKRVIGRQNDLPWYLPADLKHFKAVTLGHPVVMGRRTYDSIVARLGHPLPHRENVVVSRQAGLVAPGARVVGSVAAALALYPDEEEVCVIGGAQIFAEVLPLADRIYLTHIKADIPGDAYFPELDPLEWRVVAREAHVPDERNVYAYEFLTLER